jgi:hypothetical protein
VSRWAGAATRAILGLAALVLALPSSGVGQAVAPSRGPAPDSTRLRRPAQAAARTADTARARRRAPSSDYWSFYLLPLPTYNALEGLGVALTGGWRKSAPPGPIPTGISIEPSAQISTSGTRGVQLVFDEQGRWHGWRLLLMAGSLREQRAPYFGLGNGSAIADSLDDAYGTTYATFGLLRTTGLVAVRRRVTGPFQALLGAQWRHYRARPLANRHTKLGDDLGAGVPLDTGSTDGFEVRGGLLFDTRDEEASPTRGIFVEALVARGLTGGLGRLSYTRYALGLREFVPVGEYTSLAFRQSVEVADGRLPFFVADERMTSWRPEDGFGGVTSLRAHLPGRFTGPDKALVGADLRYRYWDSWLTPTTPVRLWLLVFADAGRVWGNGETFAPDHLHAGGGVGARLQIGRGGFFGFDLGWSPDAHLNFTTALSMAY